MGRQREPFINRVPYYLTTRLLIIPVFHLYFRGRIHGRENVPKTGPLLVVCNHASYFDPPILSSCVNRPVAYMAKEELFNVPILKQLIRLYGAFPVKRTAADRSAIRTSLNALNDGWAMGIFLQGTRTPDGKITEPKLGAAMIAAKANVPILPVSLWGTEKILQGSNIPKAARLTVRIGKLIPAPTATTKEQLQMITDECASIINDMHSLVR
ncbi:MAG TPA: 1-acyl-sn-glycerol-3-phosphate acyltransferase [Cyanobacteria bacterium UBA12227]|nr:1-acyl-sn-glycerol-3-phosphate acyltransferase [Cyanobacteria bacterium UBA12227]